MILLIDGSSLLSTNFYATLPKEIMYEKDPKKKMRMYDKILHSDDGRCTNGILGFMRTIENVRAKIKPSHMFIAFDKTRATFRRDLYPDYKGQRKETPAPLKQQFVTLEDMLKDCGFAISASDTYEADDLIGSTAEKYKGTDAVRIWTKDQDYFQLVSDVDNIRLWMPMDKDKLTKLNETYKGIYGYNNETTFAIPDGVFDFTEETAEDYFGVRPTLVPDYKGIAGDPSDNIPGVKGVSSAAIPLLNEYGSIEGIYEAIDECENDSRKEKELNVFWKESLGVSRSPLNAMKEHRDMAILSKQLATIKKDCEINWSLDDMSVNNIKDDVLNKWYSDLGMKSLQK